MDRYWAMLSDFCAGCSMQYNSGMLRLFVFFPANECVIAAFSRPTGAAAPKTLCQGLKLGIARWILDSGLL